DVQLASEDAMGDVLCSEAMKMGNQLGALSPQGAESGNQKRIDDGARAEQEHRSGQFARGDAADSVVDAANAVADRIEEFLSRRREHQHSSPTLEQWLAQSVL